MKPKRPIKICENFECGKEIPLPEGRKPMTSYCADCLKNLELELVMAKEGKPKITHE